MLAKYDLRFTNFKRTELLLLLRKLNYRVQSIRVMKKTLLHQHGSTTSSITSFLKLMLTSNDCLKRSVFTYIVTHYLKAIKCEYISGRNKVI